MHGDLFVTCAVVFAGAIAVAILSVRPRIGDDRHDASQERRHASYLVAPA